jgi:VIT1/CCC1 family predicted Fe2+/Mn2+ transporter
MFDAIGDALYAWSTAREARAKRRLHERELDAIADMNELLLRDIGAPDWLIAEANSRREVERQRLVDLNQGRRNLYL